ncbi:MAG: hypothetical protein E7588_07685 [Ruminococcaceae bacterium]|nr:hypothetical protein [Oscillospiraceae bacterium]
MKKLSLTATVIIITVCAVVAGLFSAMATDTSNDPLVTMSYVEEVLAPRLKTELTTYIQNNFSSSAGASSGTNGEATVINSGYTVVNMKLNQVLYPLSPTEIILRSGKAVVVSPFMDQGINDLTAGIELYNNDELPRYHYCLIPRGDDGRIVVATTDEIYIMVRGEFEIREQ